MTIETIKNAIRNIPDYPKKGIQFKDKMRMEKILLIEDNNEINSMLAVALSKAGYTVKSAFSGTEGLLYFSMDKYSLVLLDLMLPGLSGEEVLPHIENIPVHKH